MPKMGTGSITMSIREFLAQRTIGQFLTSNLFLYRFVDRDMLSRFLGTGVGHTSLHPTQTELDISVADTTPEPATLPPNDPPSAYGPLLEADLEDSDSILGEDFGVRGEEEEGQSDDENARECADGEDGLIALEDDDEATLDDELLLFEYDYGN